MKLTRLALVMAFVWAGRGTVQAACGGDCGADGEVTVDELVLGVNIALGSTSVGQCAAMDASADGEVTVDELVGAVNNALSGCPAPPTVTPTGASASPTPSATATVSSTPVSTGKCGDTSSATAFFVSNKGFRTVYPIGGRGDLAATFNSPTGYRLQILVLGGIPEAILNPGGTSYFLAVEAEDVFEDLEHEVNVIFNPNPSQPQVGVRGVLQCDKLSGDWVLSAAAANDPANNFVTLTTRVPQ